MGVLSLSATAAAAIQFQSQQKQSPPLLRGGVFLIPATRGDGGGGGAFSISTSTVDGLQDFRVVPSNVLTAEKEEAKAVLTLFLKKQTCLSDEAATATISKSVPFIDHLVARLHSIHKTRYLVGRELTTLEIREALIPYLEYLCEEHGDSLDDVMENFPNPPEEEREQHISETSSTKLPLDSRKLKAIAWMTEIGTDGQLPPITLYLMDIGLDMNQIKKMASNC